VSGGALSRVDPDAARDAARDIVGSRRFRAEKVPKPLEGVLEWIGDRLEPLGRIFDPIFDFFSSGIGRVVLIALLIAVVVLIAYAISRRRSAGAARTRTLRSAAGADEMSLDPDELERDAATAEAAGDLDLAIRLRFRAGLLRLDQVGAIRFRPSLTSSQVARTLRSRDFEELAGTFDAVAYGGRAADVTDVTDARDRWPRVLTEATKW
jgi:hypothetical protein